VKKWGREARETERRDWEEDFVVCEGYVRMMEKRASTDRKWKVEDEGEGKDRKWGLGGLSLEWVKSGEEEEKRGWEGRRVQEEKEKEKGEEE